MLAPGGVREKSLKTRSRIIAAAERAFSEEGLEKASLTRINQKAGQRNRSALQYHFRSREGLLRAIREKHWASIDEDQAGLLDEAENRGLDIRGVVEALVLPLAKKLDDPDGGVHYLRIMARDRSRPRPSFSGDVPLRPMTARALDRLTEVAPKLHGARAQARQILIFTLIFHGLADFSRRYPVRRRPKSYAQDREVFVRSLVDAVVAILSSSGHLGVAGREAHPTTSAASGARPRTQASPRPTPD